MARAGDVFSYLTELRTPLLSDGKPEQLVVVLLNGDFPSGFRELISRAHFFAVEGCAANRLYDTLANDEERRRHLPTYIKGDHELIRPEVARFYREQEVPIVEDQNKDTTSFQKMTALVKHWLHETGTSEERIFCVVLGALESRFDHELSVLGDVQALVRAPPPPRARARAPAAPGSVARRRGERGPGAGGAAGERSVAAILPAGDHVLPIRPDAEGPRCGIAALGGVAHVTTSGLQWDLHASKPLEMGSFLSSSNAIVAPSVRVACDAPVLWTAARRPSPPEPGAGPRRPPPPAPARPSLSSSKPALRPCLQSPHVRAAPAPLRG
eukprot:tig00000241_g20931.t1